MIQTITKKSHLKEWALVLKAFPNYRKRKAHLSSQSKVTLYGRYWDGGSRTTWVVIRGNIVERIPSRNDYPFIASDIEIDLNNPNDDVPVIVVSSGTFRGKPATACIYQNENIL